MRIAVYPGSFDPPTYGHLDIVERSARQFDKTIVAIGHNMAKSNFLDVEQRTHALHAITQPFGNVEIQSFSGLLVDFARSQHANVIIRGLRATSDFDYEFQIAMANRKMAPDIETIFLMTKWEHSYLSSSIVREVALLGGDYSPFVPPAVAEIVASHIARA